MSINSYLGFLKVFKSSLGICCVLTNFQSSPYTSAFSQEYTSLC